MGPARYAGEGAKWGQVTPQVGSDNSYGMIKELGCVIERERGTETEKGRGRGVERGKEWERREERAGLREKGRGRGGRHPGMQPERRADRRTDRQRGRAGRARARACSAEAGPCDYGLPQWPAGQAGGPQGCRVEPRLATRDSDLNTRLGPKYATRLLGASASQCPTRSLYSLVPL